MSSKKPLPNKIKIRRKKYEYNLEQNNIEIIRYIDEMYSGYLDVFIYLNVILWWGRHNPLSQFQHD